MMRPNEHWTDDEIEQTIQQLIQEGKIREIEDDKKYQPNTTEEISTSGGD
jgi:hypothetical protein